MKTTWKDIQPVPTSQEFLDIVLSRTQRRLPTQIRAGFQISRIRSEYFPSSTKLDHKTNHYPRLLHQKGQVHAGDFQREDLSDPRWLPTSSGHPSFPQGSSEHPLRCRPFPYRPGSISDSEASDRNRLPRLRPPPQIRPVAFPMQAAQACCSWSHGHHLQAP